MCWKILVLLKILVIASFLLADITVASFSYQRTKDSKLFCKINQRKAIEVAAEAAASAVAAMDIQVNATHSASQRMKVALAEVAQQAAETAADILAGKAHQLEILIKRLVDSQKKIDEGNRAISITTCTLKRVLWVRDSTRQGLETLMNIFNESKANQADIGYLAACAHQEEVDKGQLVEAAVSRLNELKNSMQEVRAELKTIRQSAKEANCAAEEARQRIVLLRNIVPKIKLLNPQDLHAVMDFLRKRRHAPKHKENT